MRVAGRASSVIYATARVLPTVGTPFGGYGKSDYGREKGCEVQYNYVQMKCGHAAEGIEHEYI